MTTPASPPPARRFDVCVLGSFMKDLVASAPRRPRTGETLHGTGFAEYLGGKGVNQAVAAARAGARTAMVGRVGDDRYGEEFLAALAAEGIDAGAVTRDPTHGTGVGLPVVEPDGANSIIIVPRANEAVSADDVRAAADTIGAAAVLTFQLELPVPAALAAVEVAAATGVATVFNPAPGTTDPTELSTLAGRVDVVVPNEVEAEQLTGMPCDATAGLPAAVEVARKVRAAWARRGAVLTLGERGAVVVEIAAGTERVTLLPAHDVSVVDTVGAGDAFCGALAARLAAGDDLTTAARYANAAGALATTRAGAVPAMPDAAAIGALLRDGPSGTDMTAS